MSNRTYDYPLTHASSLTDLQSLPANIPGVSAELKSVKIIDAFALVGATPAACTLSLGDGTTDDLYGTVTVAAGGTTGDAADITLNLTGAAYEIMDTTKVVVTGTVAPAAAVSAFNLVVGYY